MSSLKPRLFVGSSNEAIDIVYALQDLLQDDADVVPWKHADFELSKTFIENVENELEESDFGAFIFSGDDEIISREEHSLGVRDNVLLEFGLFVGALGRSRTFIVAPSEYGKSIKVASDLLGITVAPYKNKPSDYKTALGPAANSIRKAIQKRKRREYRNQDNSRRIDGVLNRGGTEYISILADAALFLGDKRHEYSQELVRRLKNREIIPMKYLYRTEHASNHWLNICKRESYQFYKNSISLLRAQAKDIATVIVENIGNKEIDLVSLGSGNGEKDNLLIREFTKNLKTGEYIYYYPVDISDTLIEATVKNSIAKGINKERIRSKAVLADFNQLSDLKRVYEERPASNVFSVLGNTIGNADEDALISSIADAMFPGDVVLIEINVGDLDINDPMLREPDNLHHDFAPLASLGVPFNEELITYNKIEGESVIDGASSVLATYKEADIDGDTVKDVKLSIVHHYDLEKFKSKIEERMNVETVYAHAKDGVGIIVAQRKKES